MILKGARKSFEAVTEANRGKKVYKRAAIGLFGLLIVSLLAIFGVSFAAGMILKDSKLEESFEGTAVMKATDGTPVSVSVTEEAKALFAEVADANGDGAVSLTEAAAFVAAVDADADGEVSVAEFAVSGIPLPPALLGAPPRSPPRNCWVEMLTPFIVGPSWRGDSHDQAPQPTPF